MNPRRLAIIAFLTTALVLAAAGALRPQDAAAQAATWVESDSTLTLSPPVTEGNCGRWPAGAPYVMEYLNMDLVLYGACLAYETGSVSPNAYWRLHFGTGTEMVENIGRLAQPNDNDNLLRVRWDNVSRWGGTFSSNRIFPSSVYSNPVLSNAFTDQPTLTMRFSSRRTTSATYTDIGANRALTHYNEPSPDIVFTAMGEVLEPTAAPDAPDSLSAARNADYDQVEVSWLLYDPVSEYEIERVTAVSVSAGENSRVEYGDLVRYTIDGTIAGVEEYTDTTVEANRTYRYRIRARGGPDQWSSWSEYVFSGAKPGVDLDAPTNVALDRADDNDSVTVSWTAPSGAFDNYTLQRQELVTQASSTIFANVVTLGSPWLSTTSLEYEDSAILPGRTYEYRVAAVKDDLVGEYSDWTRSSPAETSLGVGPENFRYESTGSRILDDRREFWLRWDAADGADDYEVEIQVYDVARGVQRMERRVVTDSMIFWTGYGAGGDEGAEPQGGRRPVRLPVR